MKEGAALRTLSGAEAIYALKLQRWYLGLRTSRPSLRTTAGHVSPRRAGRINDYVVWLLQTSQGKRVVVR